MDEDRAKADKLARLASSLDDARLLINHLALSGGLEDKKLVEPVLNARGEFNQGDVARDTEAEYWPCLAALARLARPVTVDGLRNADEQNSRKIRGGTYTKVSIYYVLAFATLIGLVLVQTYWFLGDSLVQSVKEAESKLEPYALADEKEEQDKDIIKQQLTAKYKRTPTSDEVNIAYQLKSEIPKESGSKKDLLIESLRVDLAALARWNWLSGFIFGDLPLKSASPDIDLATKYVYYEVGINDIKETQTGQLVLDALARYLLPIIYGFLGAAAFIVRDVSVQLRDLTYSFRSKPGYFLRFCLGGVTGLSVVWFLSTKPATLPDSGVAAASLTSSLSPLAWAFLSGYSVELLFTILDRLVAAFSASGPKK